MYQRRRTRAREYSFNFDYVDQTRLSACVGFVYTKNGGL